MRKSSVLLFVPALLLGAAACGSDSESSSGADDFCAINTQLDAVAEPDPTDAEAMKAAYTEIQTLVAEAADQAPSEIADAVATSKKGIDALVSALEAADYDVTKMDQTEVEAMSADVDGATATINEYVDANCGTATTEG